MQFGHVARTALGDITIIDFETESIKHMWRF